MAPCRKSIVGPLAGLLDRVGGEPQVDRAAGLVAQPGALVRIALAIALHVVEGPFHDHGQLVGKGRLEGRQPVLLMPMSGVPMDWCAPPSGPA
jgi:hypothetical protein